jgi:ABC-type multidrug transport system fused ATPase/permease subunit
MLKVRINRLRFRNIFRAIRIFSKKDQKKIALITLIQVFLGLLDLVGVAIIGVLGALAVNGIQSRSGGNRVQQVLQILHLDNYTFQTQIAILGILSAVVLILRTVLSVVFTRRILFFLSRKSAQISSDLVSRLFSQNLLEIQSKTSQQVLYAILAGVNTISLGIIGTLVTLATDMSLFVLLSIGLFLVDPLMAIGTFVIFGFTAIGLYLLMHKRALHIGIQAAELSVKSNEMILEVLNSYREAIVRNRRSFYVSQIQQDRMTMANNSAEMAFMPNISKYVLETVVIFGSLLIAAVQFLTQDATRAVAILAVFMAAGTRIAPAVLRLQQAAIQIKSSLGSAEPTLDLIESLEKYSKNTEQSKECLFDYPDFEPQLQILDLSFRYPGNESETINQISLNIPAGSSIAFVGPSGAGKTTLVDLLLGLLTPDSGSLRISNLSPDIAIKNWPGAISYVPQDVMIINGTIRDNVMLGFPNEFSRNDEVVRSLKIAQLWDFVAGLPNGLDTYVGERGAKISGGQRQRLGIARALFTNPKLLVLDEATSSLDGITEIGISEAITALSGDVTVVLIAHRLSTVRNVDQVVYLDQGKVLAVGSFDQVRSQVPDFDAQVRLMGPSSN